MSVFFREFPHEVPTLPSVSKFLCFFFSSVGICKVSALWHENPITGTIKPILNYKRLLETIYSLWVTRKRVHCNMTISLRVFHFFKIQKTPQKTQTTKQKITNKKPPQKSLSLNGEEKEPIM